VTRDTYDLTGELDLVTPPECQGQIVEVSYAWHECSLYRHTFDRSDRTAVLERCEDASEIPESWHPCNGCPPGESDLKWIVVGCSS